MSPVAERVDTLGMFDLAAGLPEQIVEAVERADAVEGLPAGDQIDNVLVLGMGGSGVAGDLLAVIAGPFMPVPVVVVKGYEPPSYVNERTLVFAMSFSGNTEETVDAVTTAANAGGRIVAVTQGGTLGELATSWGAPVVGVDTSIPQPRAGMGALVVPPLIVLERLGLFPGAGEWVARAVEQLRLRRDRLVADGNPAERLAADLARRVPIVYGGGGLGGVAATRWKTEINENSRSPAWANTNPELCHNEIAGWGQNGDLTRQVFALVNLRHDFEHPQVMRRFDLIEEWTAEVVGDIFQVRAEGEGSLAQCLDLCLFGTFTSLHLAYREGIDPGPVPVLDQVKASLAG
jgi:glucose/mannose-6-phosphate isomerase